MDINCNKAALAFDNLSLMNHSVHYQGFLTDPPRSLQEIPLHKAGKHGGPTLEVASAPAETRRTFSSLAYQGLFHGLAKVPALTLVVRSGTLPHHMGPNSR